MFFACFNLHIADNYVQDVCFTFFFISTLTLALTLKRNVEIFMIFTHCFTLKVLFNAPYDDDGDDDDVVQKKYRKL